MLQSNAKVSESVSGRSVIRLSAANNRDNAAAAITTHLSSDKQDLTTSDMRSHSGEGGRAERSSEPRRLRPNISRPMGGLGLVESQPIRSKNIWHAAPGTGDNLEGEEALIATECIAYGWLFVCLVLPIQIRFHAGNRFNWSPVTTITCQFHIVR